MNKKGAWIVVILMSIILITLFHKTVFNAGKVSFAAGGDGLQSTFGTIYHLRHDTTYWDTYAMNYPFGESLFFTGNPILMTNALKIIQDITGKDLSEKAMGLSNLWILFSFVLCALFVYLIMIELKLPWWYAVLGGVLIAMFSTQWERLSGHYNLAVAFAFPVPIYILMRFYKKPLYLTSVIFGLYMFIISARHLYFTLIITAMIIPFWIHLIFSGLNGKGKWHQAMLHFAIQIFIPLLVFLILSGMNDEAIDRTAYPWGFYFSRMKLEAIFLPIGLPHGSFLEFSYHSKSTAYVSLLGTIVFLVIGIRLFVLLFKKQFKEAFLIGDSKSFSWIFWGSVICLLLSFGLPFSPAYEKLLNYTGPLRQFRVPGRFIMPFYYLMTITAFYMLWFWFKNTRFKGKYVVLVVALLFTSFESIMHIRARPRQYRHTLEQLNDWDNKLEENRWINGHSWSEYQSMVPLPFFHVGSENYWIGDRSPALQPAFIMSIKTGLPLHAALLSRTSISQSLMNIDLVKEPYHDYEVLEMLPSDKPFLLLKLSGVNLSHNETRLISKAELVNRGNKLDSYRLSIDSIRSLIVDRQNELRTLASTDSLSSEFSLFEDFKSEHEGCFSGSFKEPVTFFSGIIPDTGTYSVSFWWEGTVRDLWPRSNLFVDLYRSNGEKYHHLMTDLFREMVLREGSWGLVEFQADVKEPFTKIDLTVYNKLIIKGNIQIDNVLIRRKGKVYTFEDEKGTWVNNRLLKE